MAEEFERKNKIHTIVPHELTMDSLYKAFYDCRKHKRTTHQAMAFEFELEKNLLKLYNDLKDESYEIGESICFVVTIPKPREVWAGAFRDRIVHHLVYNAIKERFERRFIRDTYSCIPGRGTLAAGKRAVHFARSITQNYTKKAYYMKADIANFFNSIHKGVLYEEVCKYIPEEWLKRLIKKIIFNDPRDAVFIKSPQELFKVLPHHKSLFNTELLRGLPIGNLTSQFFSNVYLNPLDQFIKHKLKCKYYCRYVDDMLLMHEDPKYLNHAYREIDKFLQEQCVQQLAHRKKCLNLVCRGFDFVGYVVKPNRTYLRTTIIKNSFRTVKEWKDDKDRYDEARIKKFRAKINSYLGMFKHVNGYRLRKKICEKSATLFTVPADDFSKISTPHS